MAGSESKQDIAECENPIDMVDQLTVVVKELKVVEITLVRISGIGQDCGVVDSLKRELRHSWARLKFSANALEVTKDFLPVGCNPKRLNGAVAHVDSQVSPREIALNGESRCSKQRRK